MMTEIWAQIPGYEHYHISNHGRVKSIGRWITKSSGAEVWFPTIILKQCERSFYLSVRLYSNAKGKSFHVHRLVALSFVDNNDVTNNTQVNHLDLNKHNNHYKNLEWTTPKKNTQHAIINNSFSVAPKGEKNGQSVLTEQDVVFIKTTRKTVSRKKLSELFNVSIKHIDRVRSGKRWGHIKINP